MGKLGIGTHHTTIAPTDDGSTVITYHSTQIVSFNRRFINLRSAGYETLTTKRRMNEASVTFGLDYHVYQERFYWYVKFMGKVYMFRDRMTLDRTNGTAHTRDGLALEPIVRWEKLTNR